MTSKPLHAGIKAALEFGPLLGFLVAYLLIREKTYLVAGTEYTGFVVVIAAFMPIFLLAIGALWYLTGKVARIQVATAVIAIVFGALSVWLNDPRLFKMKPTAIYLALALIIGVGLLRGKYWVKYIMEDMIPMKPKGWNILTKRMAVFFLLSAGANELVWRTQSEQFWVLFETLAMPIIVFIFFMAQIGLVVEYATLNMSKKKR